jgi:hypothetical protein
MWAHNKVRQQQGGNNKLLGQLVMLEEVAVNLGGTPISLVMLEGASISLEEAPLSLGSIILRLADWVGCCLETMSEKSDDHSSFVK